MPGKQHRGAQKTKPAPPSDANGLPAFVSTDTLSVLTGVSGRRLHQLISDSRISIECKNGAPEGSWHTTKTLAELFGYYRRAADKSKPNSDVEMDRQLVLEDLRGKRIKNAKAMKDLLPMLVMAQLWGEMLNLFKDQFLGFGAKIGPRAYRAKDKVEAAEVIDKEVRAILKGLPDQIEALADKIRDDEFSPDGEASPVPAAEKPGHLV